MEIRIAINEKAVFVMLVCLAVVSAIGITMAAPPDPGHSWGEIECDGCITGSNIAAGAVDSSNVDFNYAGSSTKGGAASSVAWSSITGKPSGFSDDTDNVGITVACTWTEWSPSCTVCSTGYYCYNPSTTYSITQLRCQNGVITEVREQTGCCSGTCIDYYGICPFFYSWDSQDYVFETTFIKDKQSLEDKATTLDQVRHLQLFSSPRAMIKEVDPETSHIDMIRIRVTLTNGDVVYLDPVWSSRELEKLLDIDGDELVTEQGDEVYLEFEELGQEFHGMVSKAEIEANGYYSIYDGYYLNPDTMTIMPVD